MRAKSLKTSEAERVAEKAGEIIGQGVGEFMKERMLLDRLHEAVPEFEGYSLWKGIDAGLQKGLFERVKFKGYRVVGRGKAIGGGAEGMRLHATPSKDDGKEGYYYPFVANWFLEKGNCVTEFRKGKEWGMPDVSIVRFSVSELMDELELITVEVKRGSANVSSLTQAYGYSKLAHRCYLAADNRSDLSKLKEQAEMIGIGLLAVDPKDAANVTELLSPPRSEPNQVSLVKHVAEVFDLVRCALCGVWFKRVWGRKKDGVRGTTVVKRRRVVGGPSVVRFVCRECEEVFKLVKGTDSWR